MGYGIKGGPATRLVKFAKEIKEKKLSNNIKKIPPLYQVR
jgi:hypothetical protein